MALGRITRLLAIATLFSPFIDAANAPYPVLPAASDIRVHQQDHADVELGRWQRITFRSQERVDGSESHLLPRDEDLYNPDYTWVSVAVRDWDNREERTMFVSIDHKNRNVGTLYPGSYSIPADLKGKVELLASFEAQEDPEEEEEDSEQEDLLESQDYWIQRQKFLWLETWKRVRPEGALLGGVVVPFGALEETPLGQLGGGHDLSGHEIMPETKTGGKLLGQTILGQIFETALQDPQELFPSKLPGPFQLRPQPDCPDSSTPFYTGVELHSRKVR